MVLIRCFCIDEVEAVVGNYDLFDYLMGYAGWCVVSENEYVPMSVGQKTDRGR